MNMLWCDHCGGRVPTRCEDNFFISCSNCGKVLLHQHGPAFIKGPQRKALKAAGSLLKSGSTPKQAANANSAETSAEAPQQTLFNKQHIPGSQNNPKALNHDGGETTGQNSVTIGG